LKSLSEQKPNHRLFAVKPEGKLILMMTNEKVHLNQFESVSTRIRMSMMKMTDSQTKMSCQKIQLKTEDKLIVMMNNDKMRSKKRAPASIQIRM
jgi:hypothetical protein